MSKVLLQESVSEAPVKSGSRWRVICARPGQGSSGYYSPEVLEQYASTVVPAGAQSYIQHDPSRNVKDMIGTFPSGGFWDVEEQAIVAELEVFSHWKDFVDEVGPHAGMSLFAAGEKDADGNVTAFFEDDYNGVDLVGRPGLKGSGLAELLEAAQVASGDEDLVSTRHREGKENMEIAELAVKVDGLAEKLEALVSTLTEKAQADAQVEADATAVTEALGLFESRVAKIADAEDLTDSQRKSLIESAKQPEADVDTLIESAQALTKEIRESLKPAEDEGQTGRIFVSEAKDATELGKVL